jgi:hypothetical protein
MISRKSKIKVIAAVGLALSCVGLLPLPAPRRPVRLDLLTLTNDTQMGLLGVFRLSNDSTQRLSANGRMFVRQGRSAATNIYGADLGGVLTIPPGGSTTFKAWVPSDEGKWRLSLHSWPQGYVPGAEGRIRRWVFSAVPALPLPEMLKFRIQEMLGPLRVVWSQEFLAVAP